MKSFTITTALLVLAGSAIARNCTPGLNYCGGTLLDFGKYQPQIDQALADAGQGSTNGGRDSLFYCIGGDNGIIKFIANCGSGCHDNGPGVSDSCY